MGLFNDTADPVMKKYLDEHYQNEYLNLLNGNGNSRAVADEATIRMQELARAKKQDEEVEAGLQNQLYDGSDTWWNRENKSYYSRKKNARIYTSGQYAAAVHEQHRQLDAVQKDYGLSRGDLEYGRRMMDAEKRLKVDPQNPKLLQELDDARRGLGVLGEKEKSYRRLLADQEKSGDRGFIANLGSFLAGGGWKQESGFDNAWKHYDDPVLREGWFQGYADDTMEEAADENGVVRSFRKHGANPTGAVPFAHYIPYKSRYVREAAIRLSSHRNPGGTDMYLLAAKGDHVKANEIRMRDERIMRSWKNEQEENFLREGGTTAEKVSDIVLDMMPYAGEIAIGGIVVGGGMKAMGFGAAKGLGGTAAAADGAEILSAAGARSAVSLAKRLGLAQTAKNANRLYRGVKTFLEPAAGLTVNAPAALMMASDMAHEEAVNQSVSEDENGGWHYDESNLDGATISRNSMIHAASEFATEFSGGLISKAGGTLAKGMSKIPGIGKGVELTGRLKSAVEKYIPAGARKMMKRIRFDGTLEEVGEEWLNNMVVYAAGAEAIGAKSQDDFVDRMANMVRESAKDTPTMLMAFAVLPGMALMVNASQTGMERYQAKKNLDKLTSAFNESVKAAKWREELDAEHRRSGIPETAAEAGEETAVPETGTAPADVPETGTVPAEGAAVPEEAVPEEGMPTPETAMPETAPETAEPSAEREMPASEMPMPEAGGKRNDMRKVFTPDGKSEVQVRFKIIPLSDVIHSGKKEYDQRLQPRNRDTKSSAAQVEKIGKDLHPDLLLDSTTTDMGAPIVDAKNQVVSGNGRVMGILRAGKGKGLKDYYDAVRKFAAENGIEIPEGMRNPLLVREVVGHTDLVKLAELSNRDNKLRRSDAEQAEADAKTIMEGNLLKWFEPGDNGSIVNASNTDFLNKFIVAAGDESMRNSDGSISESAEQRVRRAILAAMFSGRKNDRELIRNLVENASDDGLKKQIGGVAGAAGRLLQIVGRKGKEKYDLREELAQAFEALLEFKREQKKSNLYKSINDYLDQRDMFGRERSAEVELLTRFLGNAGSAKKIRDGLNAYADAVDRIDVNTADMFGAADESKGSVLKRVLGVEEARTLTDLTDKTDGRGRQAETRDQKDAEDWLAGLNERLKEHFPTNTPVLKKAIHTAEQDRVRKLIKEVLGKDVEFYTSDAKNAPAGLRSEKHPDKIFLNVKDNYMFTTAWHEFFHSIQGTEDGKKVMEILRNHLDAAAYERWKEYYRKILKINKIAEYTEDELWEEFCADSLGMLSARESFWKDLAEKEPGILQKFLDFLRKLKNKILNHPHFDNVKGAITQLEEVEKQIAGVLREARAAGAEARTNTDTTRTGTDKTRTGAGTEVTESKELPKIGKVWEKNGKKRLYINRKDLTALGLDPELAKYKPFVDLNDPDLKFASLNDKAFDAEAVRKIREAARGENADAANYEANGANEVNGPDAKGNGETREAGKADAGRFNQGSETPLLSDAEDAGDFQLFAETPKEAAKRDQAAEKAEADKLERAKEEARRNAPDLPMKDAAEAATETSNQNAANAATEKDFGAENTIFTRDRMEAARKRMQERIDPEFLTDGLMVSGYYIEGGVRKFADYAKAMTKDFGEKIRPYLKSFYEAVRRYPGMEEIAKEMSGEKEIEEFYKNSSKEDLKKEKSGDKVTENKETGNERRGTGTLSGRGAHDTASATSGGIPEGISAGNGEIGSEERNRESSGRYGQGGEAGLQDMADVRGRSDASERNGDGSGDVERREPRAGSKQVDAGGNRPGEPVVGQDVSRRGKSAVPVSDGTGRGTVNESEPERKKPLPVNERNHRIGKDDVLIAGGDVSKIKANIEALRLLKKLEKENRNATPEEKKVLAKYVGWGGLPKVFEYGHPQFGELRSLLTKEEYESAMESTINAHYTERGVIEKMWSLASELGFEGGKVGEFGAGIGHFLGLVPDKLADKTKFRAVELDSVTGRMLTKLYPQAEVTVAGLEKTKIANNSLSMVIGNFPFAKEGPYDENYPRFSLHNYFFARAIDAVKPGGLVIALTSNSTMDNAASLKAREWIAAKADLVGAIRLPNNAFKKNAGTEVVTDILVFRKKDGSSIDLEDFGHTLPVECKDGSGTAEINEYYVKHPEMVLGENSMTGSMYRGASYTVNPTANGDLQIELGKAVRELAKKGKVFGSQKESEALVVIPDDGTHKFGEYYVQGGKIFQQGKETAEEVKVHDNDKKRILAFLALKQRYNDVMKGMLDEVSDIGLGLLQDKLKKAYDAFVNSFGNIANSREQLILRTDPSYIRVSGLERVESKMVNGRTEYEYKPSAVFTERTIRKNAAPKTAGSLEDAAQISLNYRGAIVPEYVAQLVGMPVADAKANLLASGKFFENPDNGQLETAEKYLSGNIAEKLKAAKEAARQNSDFQANVLALEKAMPAPKKIADIGFKLGTTWVPADVVRRWLQEDLGARRVNVTYSREIDQWFADGDFYSVSGYSAGNKDAKDILLAALNLKRLKVFYKVHDKTVFDREATEAANALKNQMSERFVNFVKKNPELAKAVEDEFNTKINIYVNRDYSGTGKDGVYPGAAETINGKPVRMREHQRAVIARAIEGNTLIAHCVGAGKTFSMITIAEELKRLKLANKNLIVVQNATVEQFAQSARDLYPNAAILSVTKRDMEAKNRKRFMMMIANNDWDIIVMPQSQFNMLVDRPEIQQQYMQSKIDNLRDIIEELKNDRGSRNTVKEIARQMKSLESKLEHKLGKKKNAEDVVYFDELGIDALFIDEAHAYKKNFFVTKMPQMKGLDRSDSERAMGLTLKINQIMQKTGGRNIYLATGTPITNTLAEAWNMVRYLYQEGEMPFDCNTFDRFASMFTETVSDVEQTAAGNYKSVERFVKFTNLEDLNKFFTSVADVVLPEDLKGVKRPPIKGGAPTNMIVPRREVITNFMRYLNDLYSWYDGLSGEEKKKHTAMNLQIYTMARKASIDMRLIDASLPDDPNSKLSKCAEMVYRKWKEYAGVKGTQAVFFDLHRNVDANKREVFNAYDELKRKLVEYGIPAEEIAHMDNFTTDVKKAQLFEDVNAGRVRVIIGGTQTLGTGVNIQERLACIHHVDVPQLPSDMEQRNGRGIRQGNTMEEVEIFQYAVDRTLDASSYQMLARKDKFIKDVMKGRIGGEAAEESGDQVSYEEFAAEISGNQDAKRFVTVKKELSRLKALRNAHAADVRSSSEKLKQERQILPQMEESKKALDQHLNEFESFDPQNLTVDGKKVKRSEFATALDKFMESHKGSIKKVFTINGIPILVERYWADMLNTSVQSYAIDIPELKHGWIKYGGQFTSGSGFMQSLTDTIKKKPIEAERMVGEIAHEKKQIERLQEAAESKFEQEGELGELEAEHLALAQKLTGEQKKWDGPRPSLSDYVNAQVEIEDAIIEEETGDDVKLSPGDISGADAAEEEDSDRLGRATQFIEIDGKIVPIAEGIEFNADKDMQQVIYDFLVMLKNEIFHIAEDKIDVTVDEHSAHEYTQSKHTRQLRHHNTDGFKAKMKAAAVIGSIIENARNGRDEAPTPGHSTDKKQLKGKYRRYDIMFATPSGMNDVRVFTGELTVWMDEKKGNTLRDISNIKFNRKVREPLKRGRHALAPAKANGSATLSGMSSNLAQDGKMSSADSEKNPENIEPDVQLSPVTDPELLKQLEAEEKRGEYLTLYRAAQLVDGKLYPPMAGKINGEWQNPIRLGEWEQADEHPELIVQGNKFNLNKGNGATIDARYNPYIHSSPSPLNDQFSSAYKRPELVTLEVRVPKSELTSGYHAEHAKDSVGMQEWKAGTVSQKLSGRRQVMLSRYDKPIRIVPDSEVAQKIAEMMKGTGVAIPENVVTPSLRAELEKAGVKIEETGAKNRRNAKKKPDIQLSVSSVYTGSAADYDKPSLLYVGTGEGVVKGWGLYGSSDRDMAKLYAEKSARRKSAGQRHLYKQTFWPGKQENLLDWDEDIEIEQSDLILDGLANSSDPQVRRSVARFINSERDAIGDWTTDPDTGKTEERPTEYAPDAARTHLDRFLDFLASPGRYVYQELDNLLGSKKAASEFLYGVGIHGITYVGESDERNYVAFSDSDVRVDDHIQFSPATPEAGKAASDELFRSEKDGIINQIWDAAKIWNAPAVGEKKDVSAGASVLKNFYYQGRDVPTLGRVFEGGLRIDEFKNQAGNYMFNGNSGHDRLAEFAAWQKANKAEYDRLNEYMVKTDTDRKGDHIYQVDKAGEKWEVRNGTKAVSEHETEEDALETAFQMEKNGLIADGWKPETAEWVYQIRNVFARQYEILAKDVLSTEKQLRESGEKVPKEFATIFSEIRKMGDLRTTYFPRIRKPGKYLVYGTSPDGTSEMKKIDKKTMAAIYVGKLKRQGYENVQIRLSNQSSEDVYSDLNVAAMNETLIHAAERLDNPEKLTWESIGFTAGEDHYKENNGKVVNYFTLKGNKSMYNDLMKKFGGQWFTGSGMWRFKRLYKNENGQATLLRALTLASGIIQNERDVMLKNIMAQTADVLRMHGSRSHMISRSGKIGEEVVKGYEEDLLTAMHLSVLSVAGGYGKRNGFQLMMKAFMGTDLSFSDWLKENHPDKVKNPLKMSIDELAELGELHKEYQKAIRERMIDSSKQPRAYKLGTNFIRDMMRNETELEREMGWLKSIAGLYFLSRPSSGIINLTTMAINVPAVMSDRLRIPIHKAFQYISKEAKRFLQWKAGKLKMDETDEYFYRRMIELGFGKAEMSKDVAGTVMTWGGRAWKKVMETGLFCFAKTEEFNRFVTTAAAFRALLDQEQAKLKSGETISHERMDELIRQANKEVTLNAHGVYGKLGTLDIMRGGGVLQEAAKSAYTYKNYQHNTWQMCWDYICRGEWGKLAYVSGSSAAIAGLKTSPAVALAFMVMGMAGGGSEPPEGYEEAFYRWLRSKAGHLPERFARMGLAGLAGSDLRGSMGMEVGINALPRTTADFLGAPYAFGEGIIKGSSALVKGDFYTASQKLLPSVLAAPIRAVNEKINGIQRRGKPELYEGEPIQPDSVDMILRMVGFNPAAISEKREENRTMRSVKNKLSQERSELRNDLRNWYQSGRSRTGYLDIFQKIQRYNELAKKYHEKEFTEKDIERALK